jgi:hypothetical protein
MNGTVSSKQREEPFMSHLRRRAVLLSALAAPAIARAHEPWLISACELA